MEKKKFYKIVICKRIEKEYENDIYKNKSIEYYRYGYSEIDVITKLRRHFKMNTGNKLILVSNTKSPYVPEDFDGKIFRHLDKSYDEEAIYYEWYVQETVRTKPIKKVSILDDFLEDCELEKLKKK